jgi:REP element-mobilizing transposase RayT
MCHSYTNLLYHLVFSTKERQPWLDTETSARLNDYLGGAIRSEGGVSISINGCADHIHILAKLRQDKALSDGLRAIKANSSGWIQRTFSEAEEFRMAERIRRLCRKPITDSEGPAVHR